MSFVPSESQWSNKMFYLIIVALILSSVSANAPTAKFGDAVVIMSNGRGGSTWFCDVIKHTSSRNSAGLLLEVLGNDAEEMKKVGNPTKKVVEYLNHQRREHPTGLVGFKLKPYVDSEEYDQLYRYFSNHSIPVLLLVRNHLDREISHEKHDEVKVQAHCLKSDTKCIHKHMKVKTTVDVKHLLQVLETSEKEAIELELKLDKLAVHFLRVSYDEFGFGCEDRKLEILQRILEFLYPGKAEKASIKLMRTKFEATSDRNQSNVVANYPDVVNTLKGTKYEALLRTADPPC